MQGRNVREGLVGRMVTPRAFQRGHTVLIRVRRQYRPDSEPPGNMHSFFSMPSVSHPIPTPTAQVASAMLRAMESDYRACIESEVNRWNGRCSQSIEDKKHPHANASKARE